MPTESRYPNPNPKHNNKDTTVMPVSNNHETGVKPMTAIRVKELAKLIVKKGYSRADCMEYAEELWGMSPTTFEHYYESAIDYLMPKNEEQFKNNLIAKNFARLEDILRKALESNDSKVALEAIKTINNMCGLGGNKVRMENRDENNNTTQVFEISFGD